MLRHNLGYKLLGLAVAIGIWVYTNNAIVYNTNVPLEVRNVGSGLLVISKPTLVKVRLQVPRSQAETIDEDSQGIAAYVSLRGQPAGTHTLPVRIILPSGVREPLSMSFSPDRVSVKLERLAERPMRVEVQFAESAPVGYRFGQPELSPSRVIVSGTRAQVRSVSRLVAVIGNGGPGTESIRGDFPVVALGPGGKRVRDVTLTPEKVHLRLDVQEAPASRVVFVSPDLTGQPEFPAAVESIRVEPQTVILTGRPDRLMKTSTVLTEPVSVSGRAADFSQQTKIIVPPGLSLSGSSPVTVHVKLTTPRPPETPQAPERRPNGAPAPAGKTQPASDSESRR